MKFGIGQGVPRTEDPRLLIGGGCYADDFNLDHQCYAVMVRSDHAHARIVSIDTDTAAAMPGVLAVLTGHDYAADGLGNIAGPSPHSRRDGSPMFRPSRPALTTDRVRYLGEPVAMVIANSVDAARDASEHVLIDYDALPVVLNTGEANADGVPAIWAEAPANESFTFEKGDADAVDRAMQNAAHVVRQQFVISRLTTNAMEPRAALGSYHRGERRYTIYTGSQRPYAWRASLTKNLLHVEEHELRLVTGDVGGSFGMKGSIHPEIPLVAWASKRIGRTVKWTCERTEGFVADDHARDNVSDAELALDAEGQFLALRVRTNASVGAYLAFMGHAPPTGNIGTMAGQYRTPAMHVVVNGVFTNNNPVSPYRGAGRPEAAYIMERLVHIAATQLGKDPVELRRRNLIAPEQMPFKTGLTFTYDCGEFEQLMDDCLERSEHATFEMRRAEAAARGKLRGIGVSSTIEVAAGPQPETAELRFDASGTLTILVGTTPHGQGHETIYKQLVCEVLGLEPHRVRVIEGDTDKVSFGTGTGGSRSATLGSAAVMAGVDKVVSKGRLIAAHALECAVEDIEFSNAEYRVVGTDRQVDFHQMALDAFNPAKLPPGVEPGMYELATFNPTAANFPNGCQVCEVEIDPDTGVIEMLRHTTVGDVGVELNPALVRGQMHGGIVQGAGQALMEQMVYDDEGQLLSGSFMDYAMPRADDLCQMDVSSRPVPTATNPLGVKGAGESGTVGALGCVMNAVNDALAPLGIAHVEMPATPQRVWRAIREAS
jgi:aerobic carbon-monoxide dehydrogenase large subunit